MVMFNPQMLSNIGTAANVASQGVGPSYGQRVASQTPYNIPNAPGSLSKGANMGATVGEAALNAIPVAGPFLSMGAGLARGAVQANAADKYQQKVAGANPAVQSGKMQSTYVKPGGFEKYGGAVGSPLSGAATGAGVGTMIAPGIGTAIGAGVGALAGVFGGKKNKASQKSRMAEAAKIAKKNQMKGKQGALVNASARNAVAPRATAAPGRLQQMAAMRAQQDQINGQRMAASQGGPNGSDPMQQGQQNPVGPSQDRTAASTSGDTPGGFKHPGKNGVPSQTQSGLPTNANKKDFKGWGGGLQDLLKRQIATGLDPRILQSMQNSATQSTQDATQGLNDTFARTGDQSGYNYGIQSGMQQQLGQQMANIPGEYARQQQAYINDLINMFRSTRGRGTGQQLGAAGGSNLGAIIGGVGALGQAAGSAYGAYQNANPKAPV